MIFDVLTQCRSDGARNRLCFLVSSKRAKKVHNYNLDSFCGCAVLFFLMELHTSKNNFTLEKESKGGRRMPRLWEAKKDVVSCDKPREGANDL